MAIKIFNKSKDIKKDIFVTLVEYYGQSVLVVVNENGNVLPGGYIADITANGLELRGSFNWSDTLGIQSDGNYVKVTKG